MIRRMREVDVDAIVDVWLEASIKAHDFIDRTFWQDNQQAMREVYIPNSETWVFEVEGRVVGFYALAGDSLAALFVLPEFHGRGIEGQLLEHAKGQRKRLELAVYVENETSCVFYRKRGFVLVREQADENTGHQEYLMEYVPRPEVE